MRQNSWDQPETRWRNFQGKPRPFSFLLMFPRKREEIYKYLERTYAAIGQLLLSLLFSDVPVDFAVVVF